MVAGPEGDHFAAAARARGQRLVMVGRDPVFGESGIAILSETIEGASPACATARFGRDREVLIPLLGRFQVENALVAAGLAVGCGTDPDKALAALETLEGAKGRLEFVGAKDGAPVVVDYAHKPGALETVLEAARPFAARKLVVVVGCGGDRDPGKRPMMGRIAVDKADRVIITDDNPRSEDPAAIVRRSSPTRPGPRRSATAPRPSAPPVRDLQPGDLLVIAGKGHETGQIVGSVTLPFSDHEVALAAIRDFSSDRSAKGPSA